MRWFVVWFSTLLLAGCPGKDRDSSPSDTDATSPTDSAPTLQDRDGDGQYEDVDCNDEDPTVYPGADEACDQKDNDCDREVDEGLELSTWYADTDGDGWGDPAATRAVCGQPTGYVATAGDCDDTDVRFNPGAVEADCEDPADYNCDGSVGYADADADGWAACRECDDADIAVNPGAAEVCDGVDNNCDGGVDTDALDAETWYTDADGDGYGDATSGVVACAAPDGGVLLGGDCDDADPAYNPAAEESDCEDPNDYNCDGSVGLADLDGDGWAACEECDDADAEVNAGALERCDGEDDDCDGLVDEPDAEDTRLWYADDDADGYGDPGFSVAACDQPVGFVADASDCRDTDAAYNPAAPEACDDPNDYNCDGHVGYGDADGDGYAACQECDDGDPFVTPVAVEVCNGVDDNCDGVVDTDAGDRTVWYHDADGDGFGDDTVALTDCDQPEGFVAAGGDCDDADAGLNPGAAEPDCTDPTDYNCDGSTGYADADGDGYAACLDCDDGDAESFPGAPEICNGADNDCDGLVDVGAVDAVAFYADADGDGYGDSTAITVACAQPAGTATVGGDCDDTDAAYNPGASEADCTDPNDYNCDGSTGYTDLDGDGFAACDPDECDDRNADVHVGATEYCNDIDDNCNGVTDGDASVDRTTWYADADGDGYGDETRTVDACDLPAGYTAIDGDCNDTSSRYNPSADESDCADPNDYNCDGVTGYADGDGDGFAACEDCDDSDADVHPGADEYCNGYDDNCNGTVDGATSLDRSTWYADADGDGYGSTSTTLACTLPAGYVATSTDCDDGARDVYPGATEYCDGQDEDCDGTVDDGATDADTWYADADADGYGGADTTEACTQPAGHVATDTDCDDDAAAVNPGATEACNSVDDDCDGATDEAGSTGSTTWYADADADGWGTSTTSTTSCTSPVGYVADAGDCDDTTARVSPDATESCDGVDEDCDGATDEGAIGSTWYDDADSDGYGDPTSSTLACTAPAGTVANDDDCDDANGRISPGDVEACNGFDDDCDGEVDEAGATDSTTWYADADADGYGGTTTTTEACTAPTGYAATADDCDDADESVNPGAAEVCSDGLDNDCDGTANTCAWSGAFTVADADLSVSGADQEDFLGSALDGGDLDGDGLSDVVAGAYGWDGSSGNNHGRVYLWYGALGAESLDGADVRIDGDTSEDNLGTVVRVVPDPADGGADLALGAPGWDNDDGAVYVFDGAALADTDAGAADMGVFGSGSDDRVGAAVSAGDVDGDGAMDLLVGSPGWDATTGSGAGALGVFYGPFAGTHDFDANADALWYGVDGGDAAGTAVLGADLDADGTDDVLVGAYSNDDGGTDAGAVYALIGGGSGSASLGGADAAVAGQAGGQFGYAMAGLGDVDGDGYPEIAIGADRSDVADTDAGAVYVFDGDELLASTMSTDAGAFFTGASADDYAGRTVAGAGDADGDGTGDLLLGATGFDNGATSGVGAVYLLYGPFSGSGSLSSYDARFRGSATSDAVGYAIAGFGDTDADGLDDFGIGAVAVDNGSDSNVGSWWLFLGAGL